MNAWMFAALHLLCLWFWLCPLIILCGIGALLTKKGKEATKKWETQHQGLKGNSTT